MGRRWKLIDVGIEDEYDNPTDAISKRKLKPEWIRYKEEQSLFVSFMLNLAYVPDDVLYKLNNFEFGWSIEFFREMD